MGKISHVSRGLSVGEAEGGETVGDIARAIGSGDPQALHRLPRRRVVLRGVAGH